MAEQQLLDYIKKARDAGQADDQTRNLLYKNGWTETEVNDAVASLDQSKIQIKPQPIQQSQPQPQVASQSQLTQTANQQEPQYKSQPDQNNMPRVKKSHIVSKILISLIILVVLAFAGYFVAGQYISLPWNPFSPNPSTVISKMLINMDSVKSAHSVIQGEVSATNSSKVPEGKMSFSSTAESDTTDINNPKGDITLTAGLTLAGSTSPLASVSLNTVVVGNVFYVKLNSLTLPSNVSYSEIDMSKILGNWFKIDQDSVKALSEVQSGTAATISLPQTNNSELVKKVQDLIVSENMFSETKQLGDEVISGQNTYHYLVTISKLKLEDLMNKIITLELQTQNNGSSTQNPLVQNMAQAFVKTFGDAMGDINMEMWIGKKDYMLYETKIDKVIDLSKISKSANIQLEVNFNATNSNFNKPITVQTPANVQKIEDVLLPLLKMQKVKSDMLFIQISATGISSDFTSLCSRGLLNGYQKNVGVALVNYNNDIVQLGAKKPACFSGVKNYCISTQLADGSYSCIGNNQAIGTTKCVSAQTVCK